MVRVFKKTTFKHLLCYYTLISVFFSPRLSSWWIWKTEKKGGCSRANFLLAVNFQITAQHWQNITNTWFVSSSCTFSSNVIFRVSRGENSGSQTQEVVEQVKSLKAQISELEAQEKELDNQKSWLEENIKHLNHDPITSAYPLMAIWHFSFFLRTFAVNLTTPAALNNLNKSSTRC